MTTIKKQPDFEKSIERLEAIVKEMEQGTLSLEDMIARFEEGQSLIKSCAKKLNEVEKKVEVLVKKGGEFVAEPFDQKEGIQNSSDQKKSEDEDTGFF